MIQLPAGGADRYKFMRGDFTHVTYRACPTSDGGLEIVETIHHRVASGQEWLEQQSRVVAFYEPGEWTSWEAPPPDAATPAT